MIGKSGKAPGKMTKNTNVENTCRVCGNRGSYSLYQVIPGYLHESEREFLNWGKPINHYLTFVLNQQVSASFSMFILGETNVFYVLLQISSTDGYPQKMCTLCISYMKHAYNFKIQAFRNLGLMAMKNAQGVTSDPVESVVAEDIANLNKVESVEGIDRILQAKIAEQTSDDNLEGAEIADEEEDGDKTLAGIFSYAHTSFEEDDITQLDVFQNSQISFYLPETFKERKCMSCRRRFMFEDSYNEHIKECISLKLVSFIKEMTQLLYLRENRAVSSHEFIRRVIFGIKKSVQTVVEYDEGIKKEIEKHNQQPNKKEPPTTVPVIDPKEYLAKLNVKDVFSNSPSESDNLTNTSNTSSPVPNIFMRCPDCSIAFESLSDLEKHNYQFHNKQSSSVHVAKSGTRSKLQKLIQSSHETEESSAAEMKKNLLRIRKDTKVNYARNLNMPQFTTPPSHPKMLIQNQKLDVVKSNLICDKSRTRTITNETSDEGDTCDSMKTVKCPKCPERFRTITHLDFHVTKKHTRSPVPTTENAPPATAENLHRRDNIRFEGEFVSQQSFFFTREQEKQRQQTGI